MRRFATAFVLGLIALLSLATVASAHNHISTPAGCVNLPDSRGVHAANGNPHEAFVIAKIHSDAIHGGPCWGPHSGELILNGSAPGSTPD